VDPQVNTPPYLYIVSVSCWETSFFGNSDPRLKLVRATAPLETAQGVYSFT
jgi:hypothetical protein